MRAGLSFRIRIAAFVFFHDGFLQASIRSDRENTDASSIVICCDGKLVERIYPNMARSRPVGRLLVDELKRAIARIKRIGEKRCRFIICLTDAVNPFPVICRD